jgi:tRNA-dihydrouridine synthase B
MGCPAKKVCNKAAGSALMQDEALVRSILAAVLQASEGRVPITLKMRTGFSREVRNAVALARMAEDLGIAMVTIHGRTRQDQYQGPAEYDTIAEVKTRVRIPVVANGDIDSCEKAAAVLRYTGADAVMIGRAGQGRPWIYGQIHHFLTTGQKRPDPSLAEIVALLRQHLLDHYAFHGEASGVRSARKHIGWTFKGLGGVRVFREGLERAETAEDQLAMVDQFAAMLAERKAA